MEVFRGRAAMANDLRYKRLMAAKMAGLSGEYASAYSLMDTLLGQFPYDAEVHRLYGNILELDAFSEDVIRPMDSRLRKARRHYRVLMSDQDGGYFALFDFAEHFANIGRLRIAGHFFRRFVERCEGVSTAECEEELASSLDWLRDNAVDGG